MVRFRLLMQGLPQLNHLPALVDALYDLLNTDGDEQANRDGGDVDEEVAPGVGGGVGWVNV